MGGIVVKFELCVSHVYVKGVRSDSHEARSFFLKKTDNDNVNNCKRNNGKISCKFFPVSILN